jgi:hypothetical protein
MRARIGMTVAVLLAAAAGRANAQAETFGRLVPGQTVRVRTVGGSRFVTRLGMTPGDSLAASFERADPPFQTERVDSLWVRGHAVGTGALVGAAIATPVSFGLFVWVCTAVAEGHGCDAWGTVTGLALAAGAGGALIGAGVGALMPRWRLRYARDRDAAVSPILAPGRIGLAVRF